MLGSTEKLKLVTFNSLFIEILETAKRSNPEIFVH